MKTSKAIVFLLLTTALGLWTVLQFQAPPAKDLSTDVSDFSAARALEFLKSLAEETHELGSAGHERMLKKLLTQIESLGWKAQIQDQIISAEEVGWIRAARVRNVLVRIPGEDSSAAVMLTAHYDAVPHSPGASDDGSGTVTLLETLRALKASGKTLKNDVIALWTDGEELGLLGATAFVRHHPWAKDVAVVLNFEARGSSGPSAMFEVSEGNAFLIELFARTVAEPIASSMIGTLAKLIPNDTDMTAFRQGGLAGLNFAYADRIQHYHSPLDNLENLDLDSLQHHGDQALAMTRALAEVNWQEQSAKSTADRIYFTVWRGFFLHYPKWFGILLALLVFILVARDIRNEKHSSSLLLQTSLRLIGGAALIAMVLFLFATVHAWLMPQALIQVAASWFFWTYFALTLACFLFMLDFYEKKSWLDTVGTVLHGLGAIVGLAVTVLLPGSAYLLTLPSLAWIVSRAVEKHNPVGRHAFWFNEFARILRFWPLVILYAALIYIVHVTAGPISPALPQLFVLVLFFYFIHEWQQWSMRFKNNLSMLSWGWALGSLVAGLVFIQYSEKNPGRHALEFLYDQQSREKFWLSEMPEPPLGRSEDPWLSTMLGPEELRKKTALPAFSTHNDELLHVPVSYEFFQGPPRALTLLREEVQASDGVHQLRLQLKSPADARCVTLWLDEESASQWQVVETWIAGETPVRRQRFGKKSDQFFFNWLSDYQPISEWKMFFCAVPEEGITLEIQLEKIAGPKVAGPLRLRTITQYSALPEFKDFDYPARPPEWIPATHSDRSRVARLFTFQIGQSGGGAGD